MLCTPRYEDDLVRIYKYSARKWRRSVAERTLKQIAEVEQWTYLSGRSRVGGWRVLYVLDETGLTVKVVASRGSAYKP